MNKNWIPHPTILTGQTVNLLPLQKEHFEELYVAASDKELWQLIPTDCSVKKTFEKTYAASLSEREKGNEYPFVIYHKPTKKIIGSTRFFEIFPEHRKLEIGWTWIAKEYWGTKVNLECKLALLTFCFETLKTIRVQLKTKDTNERSRKAIEKIGGKFEGILRKDKIQANGTTRNAAYFSILDDEWENARTKIMTQLDDQ
ncbi:MAG: GNAT family protein [Ginsengibacter sp.]